MKLPMQPLHIDQNGKPRFVANLLVDALLSYSTAKGMGMNELALVKCSPEERMQFAQLIGYSLSGYGELSYVTDESYNEAEEAAAKLMAQHALPVDMFVTTWDSYTNEVDQKHLVLREVKTSTPEEQEELGKRIHTAVCEESGETPTDWAINGVMMLSKDVLFVKLISTKNANDVSTYTVRLS